MTDRPRPDDGHIDAALRRAFAPPPASVLAAPRAGRSRPWLRALPYAAAAAVVLVIVLFASRPRAPAPEGAALADLWAAAYRHVAERGLESPQCCDRACDLKSRCRELFAAPLDVAGGGDLEVCGGYCGPAGGAAALLARSGGEPVCVFVLPRARAPELAARLASGVAVYRREMGELVVFELSRLAEPRVLPRLFVPEG